MYLRRIAKESALFAICEAAFCAILMVILAFVYKFDLSVVLGAVAGWVIALAYYASIIICVNLAAEKAKMQDVEGGQKLMRMSYSLRMIGVFLVLVLCAITGIFDILALALPMLFVRPATALADALQRKGAAKHEY